MRAPRPPQANLGNAGLAGASIAGAGPLPAELPTPPAGLRRARRIPRLAEPLDVRVGQQAAAWVLGLLLRRYGLGAAEAAARAHVGPQTAREYLRLEHPGAWFTAAALAQALGRHGDDLERLARRWIGKYIRREMAAHRGEPGWTLALPWEKDPGGSCPRARRGARRPLPPHQARVKSKHE